MDRYGPRYSGIVAWLVACVAMIPLPALGGDETPRHERSLPAQSVTLVAVGVAGPVAPGSNVTLRADLTGVTGIRYARFREDAQELGIDRTPPWRFRVNNIAAGRHLYRVELVLHGNRVLVSDPLEVLAGNVTPQPPAAVAADDGVRLLLQATFGPTSADVAHVHQVGVNGWIDEQLALPNSYSHLQYMRDVKTMTGMPAEEQHAYEAIWQNFLFGNDQLRARVAFALSEIVVISNIAPDQSPWALASWMDMLYRNAFGNYRTLLQEATLHPAMGYYLNMLGNDKENPAEGYRPNENYARELEQLFSIGLLKLNLDGTPVKDAQGKTVPTYDQSVVEGFAKVFTGWSFPGNDATKFDDFRYPDHEDWINPMVAYPAHHSPGTKKLLDGVVLPAGQTPQKDLADALDLIFNHQNVGPFVSRRLIQFLVTSNPSPAYVSRVASKFNNNGTGVRGDLKAVVRAILTDSEARDLTLAAKPTSGKLREPVIRFTHLMRATTAKAANGRNSVWWLDSPEDGLGQSPLLAPSVFNFFSPFFTRSGAIAAAQLVAPEFQIHTETQVVGNANFFSNVLWNKGFGFEDDGWLKMDLSPWTALAGDPTALVDALNLVFAANMLSTSTRATLAKTVGAISTSDRAGRVRAALTLLMVTPDFVVQH